MSDPFVPAAPTPDEAAHLRGQVRRTTLLLAISLTLSWTVIQLQSSVTSVTLAALAGPGIAGIGSTVLLGANAIASVFVGRLMDARGRRPGLALGFIIGIVGALVAYAGTTSGNPLLFLAGIAVIGAAFGAVGLARVAAADLHPPETRARGISLVLMGSAFGAIVGPIVFGPLLAGVHQHELAAMATPWLVAAVVFAVGLVTVAAIRVEPMELGRRLGLGARVETEAPGETGDPSEVRPVREILAGATIRVTLLTVVIAQAVMGMAMAVVGLVMVGHGHDLASVSVTYSAHFLGMYGLVLVVGPLIDRIGHRRSLGVGLLVEVTGVLGLLVGPDPISMIPAIFLVGLGWNIAFVASTSMLADVTEVHERGRVIGLADAVATAAAAIGSLVATETLAGPGLGVLVAALTILGLVPLPLVLLERRATHRAGARAA